MAKFLHLQSDRIVKSDPWGQYELSDTVGTDEVLDVKVDGDVHPRLRINADGSIMSGNGTATPSTVVAAGAEAGDDQGLYLASLTNVAQRMNIRHGSVANPVVTSGPTFKVSRTEAATRAAIEAVGGAGTDGAEQVGAIMGVSVGTSSTEVQPVAIYGAAKNSSSAAGGGDDACAIYGTGRVTGTGTGSGIGGFLLGRRDNDTGNANALELHCANWGTVATPYTSIGFSKSQALWINCSGNADSASGITISCAFERQFENGISFTAQVSGGKTGGVREAAIRDDSTAVESIVINGSHTNGLNLKGGTFSGWGIALPNNVAIGARNAAGSADVSLLKLNAFDEVETATMRVTSRINFSASGAIAASTAAGGFKLGTGTTQLIGFWNATPVAQPTTGVTAATFVANAGTAVNDASTFDGYTLGKVVKALRNMGLLA